MVIDKLQSAIYSKFTASTDLAAAATGGMHYDVVPPSVALPFAVYENAGPNDLVDAYADQTSSDVMIMFRVIGNGNLATGEIMALLVAAYNTTLTLSGGTNFSMFQINEPVSIRLPDDQFGADVWQWSVAFSYSIQ